MYVIVWQFRVNEDRRKAFECAYGPNGAWAMLFRSAAGYLGTEFLHDCEEPRRYWTVDRWRTLTDFATFKRDHGAAYAELDRTLEGLSHEEKRLGTFEMHA